jgi:hypothetical protein
MVESLGEAGLDSGNGQGAGDRSKRPVPMLASLGGNSIIPPPPCADVWPALVRIRWQAVKDTHARLQLTRSGRDCGYAEPSRLFASRPQLRPPPVRGAMSGGVG